MIECCLQVQLEAPDVGLSLQQWWYIITGCETKKKKKSHRSFCIVTDTQLISFKEHIITKQLNSNRQVMMKHNEMIHPYI